MAEPSLHNERELLQRAAEGSQSAFTTLFMRSRHKLFSFLLRLTDSAEMTEDIIQDIFLKLWISRANLTTIDNFSSYLFRMAQNQCVTHFRRMARESLILAQLEKEALTAPFSTEDSLALKEARYQLRQAVDKLTPQQKRVFTLSRENGLKHNDIAAELNISASTVKNHMIDALRIIRQHFQSTTLLPLVISLFTVMDQFQKIK